MLPDELFALLQVCFCDKISCVSCQSFGIACVHLVVFDAKNGAPLCKGVIILTTLAIV